MSNRFRHVVIAACFGLLAIAACERIPQSGTPEVKNKPEIEKKIETIQLPMESLIDEMVASSRRSLEEEQRKGRKNTVGLVDGKWWLEANDLMRVMYLRSLGDMVSALSSINLQVMSEISVRQTRDGLKSMYVSGRTYAAGYEAESYLSGRIEQVMAGHSFGDVAQAVTNFYRNKPLQKDRAVIWVLAVPLYKESQETQPRDKRMDLYESIALEMEREGNK